MGITLKLGLCWVQCSAQSLPLPHHHISPKPNQSKPVMDGRSCSSYHMVPHEERYNAYILLRKRLKIVGKHTFRAGLCSLGPRNIALITTAATAAQVIKRAHFQQVLNSGDGSCAHLTSTLSWFCPSPYTFFLSLHLCPPCESLAPFSSARSPGATLSVEHALHTLIYGFLKILSPFQTPNACIQLPKDISV